MLMSNPTLPPQGIREIFPNLLVTVSEKCDVTHVKELGIAVPMLADHHKNIFSCFCEEMPYLAVGQDLCHTVV